MAFEKDKVHCAIGMLMMLDAINDDGSIRPSRAAKLTKPILWSYIFYLQKHNRAKPAFAALGKTNKVTDASLARLVADSAAPIQAIRKAQLIAFINRAASAPAPDALSLPFMSGRKHQQAIVADFNKHVVGSIERQIDYQFTPVLHPAVFESGNGEVKVRMEIHMEKVGSKKPSTATAPAQPRKTRRTQATAE
jgi:hypothetical protein